MPRTKSSNSRNSDPIYSIARWGPKKPGSTEIPEQSVRSGRIKKAKTIFDPSYSGKNSTPPADPEPIKRPEKIRPVVDQEKKTDKRRPSDVERKNSNSEKRRRTSESTTLSRDSSSNASGDGGVYKSQNEPVKRIKIETHSPFKKEPVDPLAPHGRVRVSSRARPIKIKHNPDGPPKTCKLCLFAFPPSSPVWTKCATCTATIHKDCSGHSKSTGQFVCRKCNTCNVCCAPLISEDHKGSAIFCAGSECNKGCHSACASFNGSRNRTPGRKWYCNNCKVVEILAMGDSTDDSEAAFEGFVNNVPDLPSPSKKIQYDNSNIPDAKKWTSTDVYNFFVKQFPNEAPNFQQQEIDGMSLLLMRRSDVIRGMGFRLGPALRIYKQIVMLQTKDADPTLTWY